MNTLNEHIIFSFPCIHFSIELNLLFILILHSPGTICYPRTVSLTGLYNLMKAFTVSSLLLFFKEIARQGFVHRFCCAAYCTSVPEYQNNSSIMLLVIHQSNTTSSLGFKPSLKVRGSCGCRPKITLVEF